MTLKAKYRELLGLDDADTRAVSQAVYDICEYLVGLDDDGSLNRSLAPIRARALYHPPCQLMAHGVGLPALDLLALVPGLGGGGGRAGLRRPARHLRHQGEEVPDPQGRRPAPVRAGRGVPPRLRRLRLRDLPL